MGRLNILQVNTSDARGGAAHVAAALHRAYRARSQNSWLVVGHKTGVDPHTLPIGNDLAGSWWQRPFWRAEDFVARRRFRGARWLRNGLLAAAYPNRVVDWYYGYEDFHFPGTASVLDKPDSLIDILNLHNLHGRYFDLRALPGLTARTPTVLTLHDAWLLSGHCAHSLGCERWREGCGHCPDLTIYPSIRRDATAVNWQRKHDIYARSRYHVIAPCQWLADRVPASPLAAGLQDLRLIPFGVDRDIFLPGDQAKARQALQLPENSRIILMVANGIRGNPWKDFASAQMAFVILAGQDHAQPLLVLVIGDSAPEEKLGALTIRYVPFVRDQILVAKYFQAADLYLSTSRMETFSLTNLEALASGIPVVATAVGGTPEQILSWPKYSPESATGILVEVGDPAATAVAITHLLKDEPLRRTLGQNAAQRAALEFDFNMQVDRYLAYYRDILSSLKKYEV